MSLKFLYIAVITIFFFPAAALAQWSAPSLTPPNGNVTAPINVSGTAQSKVGGLLLNTGNATNGLIVQYGKVGIGQVSPTYKLEVNGDVGASEFRYLSDRSLKASIHPLENSLARVARLQGVSFVWKADGRESVGLIAQDVEKVFPELVSASASGIKSVEYGNLVAPLIEAIKEQQKQIEELRAEIAALKAINN